MNGAISALARQQPWGGKATISQALLNPSKTCGSRVEGWSEGLCQSVPAANGMARTPPLQAPKHRSPRTPASSWPRASRFSPIDAHSARPIPSVACPFRIMRRPPVSSEMWARHVESSAAGAPCNVLVGWLPVLCHSRLPFNGAAAGEAGLNSQK